MATSADETAAARLAASQSRVRAAARTASGARRGPVVAALVIGIGLIAAPFIFQMLAFDNRAPKGGQMINEFRPFMTAPRLASFNTFMQDIDQARAETGHQLLPAVEASRRNA